MTSLFPLLLAQEAAPSGGNPMGMFIPMILIMVMFYFILIRPQRRQQKALEQLRRDARVGDKIVTIGGVHGIISGMTERTVSVKIAEGLSVKFDRSAIATVSAKGSRSDEDEE